jgi:hypothetical protein
VSFDRQSHPGGISLEASRNSAQSRAKQTIIPILTIVSRDEEAKVPFPWSAFLSQPVFHPKHKLILNPHKFRQVYEVRLLESCLRKFPSTNFWKMRDK